MKLELKHLVPYLPYGLKVRHIPLSNHAINGIYLLDSIWLSENGCSFIKGADYYFNDAEPDIDIKPLLIPLIELRKPQIIEGENIIPYTFGSGLLNSELKDIAFNKISQIHLYAHGITLTKLFEWHYDVFGLIDAGLALNKTEATYANCN